MFEPRRLFAFVYLHVEKGVYGYGKQEEALRDNEQD